MLFATVGQAWVFLATAYAGLAIGALYDVGRILRDALRAGRRATMAVDVLFWLAASAVMFYAIYRAGANDLRPYMLLGFACGWALYELAISSLVMRLYRLLRDGLRKAAGSGIGSRLFK